MSADIRREITLDENGIEEGFLNTANGRIWYRISGKDKAGTPMLCLHGGPAYGHYYMEPVEGFSDERPVIQYDQLGCGDSDRPDAPDLWSTDYFADELGDVISALGLKDFILMGHSWGAMLAMYYMVNRTQNGIRAAILSSPIASFSEMGRNMVELIRELPAEIAEAVLKGEEAGDYTSELFARGKDMIFGKYICRIPPQEWPMSLVRSMTEMGQQVYMTMWGMKMINCTGVAKDFDVSGQLGEIKVPVLLTCGEYDYCTPSACEAYRAAMPDAELAVVADAAHHHLLEQPEAYRKAVKEWIGKREI